MKEILSTNDIALLQNVSGSRIRQIWSQVQDDKDSTGYLQSLEDRLGVSLIVVLPDMVDKIMYQHA